MRIELQKRHCGTRATPPIIFLKPSLTNKGDI
jgi:hypothetical protein